jgi:hypothetical protein
MRRCWFQHGELHDDLEVWSTVRDELPTATSRLG